MSFSKRHHRDIDCHVMLPKKRKSNDCLAIMVGPEDGNVSDGDSDGDDGHYSYHHDQPFNSEWFIEHSSRLFECINEELGDHKFLDRIKDDDDIFVNDIEENIEMVVNNVINDVDEHEYDEDILELLHSIIKTSINESQSDSNTDCEGEIKMITENDITEISKKTLELINEKVEEFKNFF